MDISEHQKDCINDASAGCAPVPCSEYPRGLGMRLRSMAWDKPAVEPYVTMMEVGMQLERIALRWHRKRLWAWIGMMISIRRDNRKLRQKITDLRTSLADVMQTNENLGIIYRSQQGDMDNLRARYRAESTHHMKTVADRDRLWCEARDLQIRLDSQNVTTEARHE